MKAVADALEVARSHLHEKVRRLAKPRGSYRKPDDRDLLPLIRRLVDERPTYGYHRITALANRELVPILGSKSPPSGGKHRRTAAGGLATTSAIPRPYRWPRSWCTDLLATSSRPSAAVFVIEAWAGKRWPAAGSSRHHEGGWRFPTCSEHRHRGRAPS